MKHIVPRLGVIPSLRADEHVKNERYNPRMGWRGKWSTE
jgi:hypothetical protein